MGDGGPALQQHQSHGEEHRGEVRGESRRRGQDAIDRINGQQREEVKDRTRKHGQRQLLFTELLGQLEDGLLQCGVVVVVVEAVQSRCQRLQQRGLRALQLQMIAGRIE